MARLQILELPEGAGDDRPPFALVVDGADEAMLQALAFGVTVEADGHQVPFREHLKAELGARTILVFEETIDIPANEVSIGPDGYPVRLRVEGDFTKLNEQAEEIARGLQDRFRLGAHL